MYMGEKRVVSKKEGESAKEKAKRLFVTKQQVESVQQGGKIKRRRQYERVGKKKMINWN